MKNTLIVFACLLVTGICIAQTISDTSKNNETIIGIPKERLDAPEQRHPTADLVQHIQNRNADNMDVLIQYQENKETSIYANELKQELTRFSMKVNTQPSAEPVPPYGGTRYVNCSYQIMGSFFVITVYPQKKN